MFGILQKFDVNHSEQLFLKNEGWDVHKKFDFNCLTKSKAVLQVIIQET